MWILSLTTPPLPLSPCNHDYKGNLICFIQSVHLGGLSASVLPHILGSSHSSAVTWTRLLRFITCSCFLKSSAPDTKDSTWYNKGVLFLHAQQLGSRSTGSKPLYENFATGVWSAQAEDSCSEPFCSLSVGSVPLQEVINCHHFPSNTHAAAQTGTPGPWLELWATYSPAGITQTTA